MSVILECLILIGGTFCTTKIRCGDTDSESNIIIQQMNLLHAALAAPTTGREPELEFLVTEALIGY
jgi:hypothetical protein